LLKRIDVSMTEANGTVSITSHRTEDGGTDYVKLESTLELRIPPNARLRLQTRTGSIAVTGSPVYIEAKNTAGAMAFELSAPPGPNTSPHPAAGVSLRGSSGRVEIQFDQGKFSFIGPLSLIH
jgi:hypothetical protein